MTIKWRSGRGADEHNVYFSTDEAAVTDVNVPVNTVYEPSVGPLSLDLGSVYYWRVNEVVGTDTWEGQVWNFTTQEYIIVEDFEAYTDDEPDEIFNAWSDGYGTNDENNGSTIGYPEPVFIDGEHFVETDIVYSGGQSGPLFYDNTGTADYSEAELVLDPAQDWTGNAADEVIMHFRGNAVEFYESDDGYVAMSAEGTDIYGTEDEFRYAYKTLRGDGSITVRVDSIQNANVWSKAGIMIRNSLDPNSVHVTAILAASGIAEVESRTEKGGSTTNTDVADFGSPCWLRITRSGDDFTAECSKDGLEWQSFEADTNDVSTETIEMGNTVYIGLVVTSHEPDVVAAATFYNPTTTGNVTGDDWTVEIIGDDTEYESMNTIDKLYIALEDNNGNRRDVYVPEVTAVGWGSWYEWIIPQSEFTSAGVDMTSVKKIIVGVGDPSDPMKGEGLIFIDDIGYGRSIPEP
jgi:regulation of enolase protein 1 (concanavalin A-like superfamily)